MLARCLFYYITDRTTFAADEPTRRRRLLEKIEEAARAGVDYIQLREKDLPTRELESLARDAVSAISKTGTENPKRKTRLLINSRADVALSVGADGVHLRSHDISPPEVKAIWGMSRIEPTPAIGVSCHSLSEVAQATVNGASFAVFAPVFEKKDSPSARPTGLQLLCEACQTNIPVLALGGVTLANAAACFEAGAAGIAGIRLFQENDIAAIVKAVRLMP
jgi:thiamine-phosphate pyrophosphorylase